MRGKTRTIITVILVIIAVVCMALAILAVVAVNNPVLAEEIAIDGGAVAIEPTLWSRMSEWFDKNLASFLGGVNIATVLNATAFVIVNWRSGKKTAGQTVKALDANTASNAEIVNAVNTMIEYQNDITAKFVDVQSEIESIHKNYAQNMTAVFAVLDILVHVYQGNKNIPQGTKDYVMLQYTKCLEGTLGKDKQPVESNVIELREDEKAEEE